MEERRQEAYISTNFKVEGHFMECKSLLIQGVSYCFGFFYRAPVTNLKNNLTCTDGFYMAKGWEF